MAIQKKTLVTKLPLIVLASLLLVSSVFSALIMPSQTTQAAQAPLTSEQCYEEYHGEEVSSGNLGDIGFSQSGCSDYCTPTTPSGGRTIRECGAGSTESDPLVELVCGSSPNSSCVSDVRRVYAACRDGIIQPSRGGEITNYGDGSEGAARCFKAQFGRSTPSIAALAAAIDEGEAAGEAGTAEEREACEAEGRVYEDGECVEGEGSACNIDGIGWIVCPVMTFIGNIVDMTYTVVEALLTVPALDTRTGGNNPLYNAWAMMRNFANVAFVIAFLVIIYSQITGMGLNNYGIKKMLPRIIIAAILVNVSYWLCAIMVDISNITGASIAGLFDNITESLNVANANGSPASTAGQWVAATALILGATGVLLYVGLSVLLPVSVAALIAVITVVVILIARQAIIILLIVLAPLAFVAFLLPNTQKWFDRWKDSFIAMLIMFPLIALIFGASQLASYILAAAAGGQIGTGGGLSQDTISVILQVAALGVAVIPLIITPFVMKMSTGILGQIGAYVNNPNRGPLDKLRKGADSVRESRQNSLRADRLNGVGKNKLTRAWRRAAAKPARIGMDLQQRGDKNKAAAEAAEAGVLLDSAAASEAGRLRMAKSAADSARQAGNLKELDSNDQLAALGQKGTTNQSLISALDSQEKSAEKQAIQEVQGLHGKDSVDQLREGLQSALDEGNTVDIQAYIGLLDGRGPAGIKATEKAIERSDARTDTEKAANNWDIARTEFSRSVGSMMGQSEVLKQYSVSTEIGSDNKLTDGQNKNISYKDAFNNATTAGSGAAVKLDKFKNQHDGIQAELVKNDAVPIEVMRSALDPVNAGSFNDELRGKMRVKVDQADAFKSYEGNIATSSGSTQPSAQQTPPTSGGGASGTLNVPHSAPAQSTTAPSSTAAPSATQTPAAAPASSTATPSVSNSAQSKPTAAPQTNAPTDIKISRDSISDIGQAVAENTQQSASPPNPATARTSPPPNTGGYQQRQSGLYTPPSTNQPSNTPTSPPTDPNNP